MFSFLDRRGGLHELVATPGDSVATTLLRNGVPPTSVLTTRDGSEIVADDHVLSPDRAYTAKLIEGYDLARMRQLHEAVETTDPYVKRRLSIAIDGRLTMERAGLDVSGAAAHVDGVVQDTIAEFRLLSPGDRVVLGLSGGVDSGSLLMLLADYRDREVNDLEIQAVTFQDFDSKWSETFGFAARLAEQHRVSHRVLEPGYAEHVFHLNRPIAQILMFLMETDDAHLAMYVDHHSTRRVLEAYADEAGARKLALGLHTTDLLAGLLNSYTTSFDMGGIPRRVVGPYTYVLPLAFVPKRELHLYYLHRTGHHPKQTEPNQWEFNPSDRNFFYYLADHMQWQFPGVETWMFTTHDRRVAENQVFETCENCGADTLEQSSGDHAWPGICDVCTVLDKHGWIDR